jgi:hypothetical protein
MPTFYICEQIRVLLNDFLSPRLIFILSDWN